MEFLKGLALEGQHGILSVTDGRGGSCVHGVP